MRKVGILLVLLALLLPMTGLGEVNGFETVFFGSFEQDNDTENGAEPIEWLVLGEEKGYKLLLSRYGLDCAPYTTYYNHTTWAGCTLREWLGGEFLSGAFTSEEAELIRNTSCVNSKKTIPAEYKTNHDRSTHISTGNNTRDKVFLLSYKELTTYMPDVTTRACEPTPYAKAQGAYWTETNGCGWWWLRSMGSWTQTATVIYTSGNYRQLDVCLKDILVRPAIWVSEDAACFGDSGSL